MTKDERWSMLYQMFYRVFCCFVFLVVGFSFLLVPALEHSTHDPVLKGVFRGIDIGLTAPVLIIIVGLLILTGFIDFALKYATGFKTALKKTIRN